ncbi:MAG: glycosyltransferase family 2 protein [Bacteroidales bacterium]|nr:glycosyltransferase family 2 protein [Bacteroidales bacterium]
MKILTVISNYNEEKAIHSTIVDFLNNSTINSDLLVIDNCSTDDSLKIVRNMKTDYLRHPVNTGGSSGVLKTAFEYAFRYKYDIYCHMDGDNQHKASELQKIIEPILRDEADVVTGSRFIDKEGYQSLFMRRQTIFFFSWLVSSITKSRFTDITSGFRAFNRKAIEFFAIDFRQEIETIVQLELVMFYSGLRSTDVQVTMEPRKTGRSEYNLRNILKFPAYNIVSLFGTLIQNYK